MSVIDPQSFKLLQTLELLRETGPAYLEKKAFFDDCLLAGLSGGRLALAQRSGDGEWSVVLTGDASVLYDTDCGMLGRSGTASWSWDGCRLACAEPVWAVHGSADFILSVYGREGLLYAGVFESTLDRDSPHEGGMSVYSDQGPECCSVSWHSTETEEK